MIHPKSANIHIHPYRMPGWKGWVIAISDPDTDETWQRLYYYKRDAEQLKAEIEGLSLRQVLYEFGTHYFERVK